MLFCSLKSDWIASNYNSNNFVVCIIWNLKAIFNYLSNQISKMYNEKRYYNFWTKFCDSSHSARYFSISHRAKKGYELNISPNLCLIRILQWFHQRNQMALELFRNSSKILSEFFENAAAICSEFEIGYLPNHVVTNDFSCFHHKMYINLLPEMNAFRFRMNYLYKLNYNSI